MGGFTIVAGCPWCRPWVVVPRVRVVTTNSRIHKWPKPPPFKREVRRAADTVDFGTGSVLASIGLAAAVDCCVITFDTPSVGRPRFVVRVMANPSGLGHAIVALLTRRLAQRAAIHQRMRWPSTSHADQNRSYDERGTVQESTPGHQLFLVRHPLYPYSSGVLSKVKPRRVTARSVHGLLPK